MNRQQRKASLSNGRRLQKLPWSDWVNVTRELRQIAQINNFKNFADAAYKNNKYIVQIYYKHLREEDGKTYTKVMVRRSDSQPIYSWNDLYRIKNELFGEEVEAIQFMPKVSQLTDVANLYWFFIEEVNE